jgi:hypothetical protein
MKSGSYVVDASVAIKLFINERFSDQAEALFGILEADPPGRIHVPDLFFIECTNILWKHIKRFGYPEDKAHGDLAALKALSLYATPIPGAPMPAPLSGDMAAAGDRCGERESSGCHGQEYESPPFLSAVSTIHPPETSPCSHA